MILESGVPGSPLHAKRKLTLWETKGRRDNQVFPVLLNGAELELRVCDSPGGQSFALPFRP
jgi:hypothetical protein